MLALLLLEGLSHHPDFQVPDAGAETQIIPSVTFSERYDTNVFRVPEARLPGRRLWDFTTSVTPEVQILNKFHQADTTIKAQVSGNHFVNNPELNFVSTNVRLYSNLDGWVQQYVRGASLQISDSFRFTPEPPAFLTGTQPEPTAQRSDLLVRGIQAARANTYTNAASARGSLPVTRRLSLRGDYSFSLFRVGSTLADPGGSLAFFSTNLHDWSVGSAYRLTRADHVSLNYRTTEMSLSGAGLSAGFTARGVAAEYARLARDWTATLTGGATHLEEGDRVYFTGSVAVTAEYDASTHLRAAVSREIAPAFFGTGISTGGALVSTSGGVSVDRKLSKLLIFTGSANYAVNQTAPVDLRTYTSYRVSLLFTYQATKNIVTSLSYAYTSFAISGLGDTYQVDRNVVMLSVTGVWR